MNFSAQGILSKFQRKYEISFLRILNLNSGEELYNFADNNENALTIDPISCIKTGVNACLSQSLEVIIIDGIDYALFIKSLDAECYLVLSLPSDQVAVGEVRAFLTMFKSSFDVSDY